MDQLFARKKPLKSSKMARIPLYIVFILICAAVHLFAQEKSPANQDAEKIRGSRFIPYPNYSGSPFLNDKFLLGEIELLDGTKLGNVGLNYGTYRDELIYYNTNISIQIVIDKPSLNGFSFVDQTGRKRIFRRQFFNGYFKGDCFFELLSEGKNSLLVYRKTNLEANSAYYSKTGMAYMPAFVYYIYSPLKGYDPVKISRKSLLSKFTKTDQKLIKKTLRKSGVYITDEISFVKAWNLVGELGLEPI